MKSHLEDVIRVCAHEVKLQVGEESRLSASRGVAPSKQTPVDGETAAASAIQTSINQVYNMAPAFDLR